MKKINLQIFVLAGAIALVIFACRKSFLDVPPVGSISEENLRTKAGINGLLIGAYALVDGNGLEGANASNTGIANSMIGGIAGDDAHKGGSYGANGDNIAIENHTVNPTNGAIREKWRAVYAGVQRANGVLRMLALLPENTLTEDEALQIRAEAVFLRGIFHLEALKHWKNVPYVDETISYETNNFNLTNTVPIWSKVEADFQFAADNLTETKTEVGRGNNWAARAFLVKCYMFQHKFNEAKVLLDSIIADGVTSRGEKYALVEKYQDTWNATTKNSTESIFAAQSSVNDGTGGNNGNVSEMINTIALYGGGTYQPSMSLVNSYKTNARTGLPLLETFNDSDVKNDYALENDDPFTPYTGTLDPRLDWTVGRRGVPFLDWGLFTRAWIADQLAGGPYAPMKSWYWKADEAKVSELIGGWVQATANNQTLIRFADLLLWAAEVEVEVGSLTKAEKYVNMVRQRAANPAGVVKKYKNNAAPELGFTTEPAANYKIGLYNGHFARSGKEFARESVRFERKLELAMEGHRFYDLQRYDNNTGYMADVLNEYIAHETKSYDYENLMGAQFIKGKNEIFPIPQSEIDNSVPGNDTVSTMVQNPEY